MGFLWWARDGSQGKCVMEIGEWKKKVNLTANNDGPGMGNKPKSLADIFDAITDGESCAKSQEINFLTLISAFMMPERKSSSREKDLTIRSAGPSVIACLVSSRRLSHTYFSCVVKWFLILFYLSLIHFFECLFVRCYVAGWMNLALVSMINNKITREEERSPRNRWVGKFPPKKKKHFSYSESRKHSNKVCATIWQRGRQSPDAVEKEKSPPGKP